MIRAVIREAWRQSPALTVLSVPATVLSCVVVWILLCVWLGAAPGPGYGS